MGSPTTYLIDMEGKVVQEWENDFPLATTAYLLENGHLLRTAMARRGPSRPGGGPPRRDGGPPRRDANPAESDPKPPERDANPAEPDAKPAKRDAKPGEPNAKPAERDAKPPMESNAKPPQRDGEPPRRDAGSDGRPPGRDGRRPRPGWGPPGFGGGPRGLGGGGAGGRVQEFTWDGELVWDFELASDTQLLHHDIERLPNGNVLMIVWERKTAEEAIAAGRNPRLQGNRDLQPDFLVEVKPTGKTTGEIVWEWHIWDHLIQDHDSTKASHGDVAAHPELIDINYTEGWAEQLSEKEAEKLRSLGYLGPRGRGLAGPRGPDWTHTNSIAYNAQLDQIVLSVHAFHEIWVIDHSTTTEEAAGHAGGRSGKGGDLLYRWGNPRAYRAGKHADQRLFAQHDACWIPPGLPGEGHLMVFNNGRGRPEGNYSSVDEIVPPPVDKQGRYARKSGAAFGPEKPVWSYAAPKKAEFFASHICGAHRLPNGNTIICSGERATIFEVTPQKEVVWKYTNPRRGGFGPGGFGFPPPGRGPGSFGGPGPWGAPPRAGQILPSFLQAILRLKEEQKTQLDQLQKDVDGKLDKVFTAKQKEQLRDMRPGFGPNGFGTLPRPGQLMTPFMQAKLKLTDQQKRQVEAIQKEADGKFDEILTDEQKKQFGQMRKGFAPGGFAGPPGFGRRGRPDGQGGGRRDGGGRLGPRPPGGFPGGPFGPPGGGPGGFGFGPPGGGPGGGQLFRAYRYGPNYPGLVGKDLTPGKTIEELQAADADEQRKQDG